MTSFFVGCFKYVGRVVSARRPASRAPSARAHVKLMTPAARGSSRIRRNRSARALRISSAAILEKRLFLSK